MSKEISAFTPENQHNLVSMQRAIQARHAYENIHDEMPEKTLFVVKRDKSQIFANPTVIAVWRGFEKGCANQLRAEGHNSTVNGVYEDLEGFMQDGEQPQGRL